MWQTAAEQCAAHHAEQTGPTLPVRHNDDTAPSSSVALGSNEPPSLEGPLGLRRDVGVWVSAIIQVGRGISLVRGENGVVGWVRATTYQF